MKGKIVAFDFGESRIGAASGYVETGVATGLGAVTFEGRRDLRKNMEELISKEGPEQIIVGYPLNMDGSRGERCEEVEKFARRLKGWFGIPIVLWDERLTTSQAVKIQREAGVSDRKARAEGLLDRASAILILQSWFDSSDREGIALENEGEIQV
jgi:putative Holliday junction resolvase